MHKGPGLVLKIGGDKVSQDEYTEIMKLQISDTAAEFALKSGTQADKNFWSTPIDGKIPSQVLAEETMERLKKIKATYTLAKEQGYIEDDSYEGLVKRWKAENERRAKKIKNGEPVYGLEEFTFDLYLEYEMDNIQKQYCDNPDNEGMNVTDEERRQYYEEHKKERYRKDDDITLEYVAIHYAEEGMSEEQWAFLKAELVKLYKRMGDKDSLYKLAKKDKTLEPYAFREVIPSGEAAYAERSMGSPVAYAAELKAGEVSQVIDEDGCLYLIQCSARRKYGYQPIDELKDNINKDIREQRYDSLIEKRAGAFKVETDKKQLYAFTQKQLED